MSACKEGNPKDMIANNKLPLHLLPPVAKAEWAMAHLAGALKYGAWNWRATGVRASVYLSALQRHLDKFLSGESHDLTDGTHHLGNIMACCAILLDAGAAGKLTDDRAPALDLTDTLAECELLAACLRDKYEDRNPKHYTIADSSYEDEEGPVTLTSAKWPAETDKSEFAAAPFTVVEADGYNLEEDEELVADAAGYVTMQHKAWR